MRSPFAAGDAETLRALARNAGFEGARVLVRIRTIRYPSAQDLLWQEVATSPLAPAVAALDRAGRDALTTDTVAALAPWMGDDGLVVPAETHVVLA